MREKDHICTCDLCLQGNYNSEDYYVDMSFLKKERPVGVSGLLRVKNDAGFLSTCIDSCINALDELIICYQDCTDNAPDIIREKQSQYPDKIKVYYYAPLVYCWGLTDEETKYAFSLPESSLHKLCNYYNYTLSKATYRYAMKIDSDQIYFTEKLKRFCDAYRREEKVRYTLGNYFVKYYNYYCSWIARESTLFYADLLSQIPCFRDFILKQYESYLLKEITNSKKSLSMSGVNLGYEKGKWGIYFLNKLPFNGMTDHLIFKITEQTYYTTVTDGRIPIEVMKHGRVLHGGWFWYHLQGMRECMAHYQKIWMNFSLMDTSVFCFNSKTHNSITLLGKLCKRLWVFPFMYEKQLPAPDELLSGVAENIKKRCKSL